MTDQKRPITVKLEESTPEDLASNSGAPHQPESPLEAFMQSAQDDPGSLDEPLHIIPIITASGEFQGYFLPVAIGNAPTEPEGTVESFVTDAQPGAPAINTALATAPRKTAREAKIARLVSLLLLCSIAFLILSTALYAIFATTTITITPQEQSYRATLTLHLVTGVPTSLTQVEARHLLPITLTQALSTQATGSYQQQPTYALGYLTFYNGSFSSVTIQAGSQFTGLDGVSVVTTKTASVPGVDQSANPPALGQATIAAQAANMGSGGNIGAYDINGTCSPCGPSVLVKNTQGFTGGQDAKTFTIVRQSDIDTMKAPLNTSIQQSMSTTIQGQARPSEKLLLSPCNTTFTANHRAGDEAQSVTLSASETCSGLAYSPAEVLSTITKIVQAHTPGTHYLLMQTPTVFLIPATLSPIPTISARVKALFVYWFTTNDRQHLAAALAGMKPGKAYQVLLATPGIDKAVISGVPYNCTIPSDTTRIAIRFLY